MANGVKSWRACRVHMRPGQAPQAWVDVPWDDITDLDIVEGDLCIASEHTSVAWRFAAGAWSWFEWVK